MKHAALLLTALIAMLIAYGTLTPPGAGGAPLPLTDKQIHFLAFAFLTLPYSWVRPHAAWGLVILAILYGGAIELIQPMVERGAEWGDLLADSIGAMSGVVPGLLRRHIK